MAECGATFIWTPANRMPVEGARPADEEGGQFPTLTAAIRAYRVGEIDGQVQGLAPWIKPHGAGGAGWLNKPQIEAIARTLEAHGII